MCLPFSADEHQNVETESKEAQLTRRARPFRPNAVLKSNADDGLPLRKQVVNQMLFVRVTVI